MDLLDAIPASLLAAIITVLVAFVAVAITWLARQGLQRPSDVDHFAEALERSMRRRDEQSDALSKRLGVALRRLRESARETEGLLIELEALVETRATAVTNAESRLKSISEEEGELRKRVARLEAVEPEAAKEMASIVGGIISEGDKRSGRRDYFLFFCGVVVSAVVSIVLGLVGLA